MVFKRVYNFFLLLLVNFSTISNSQTELFSNFDIVIQPGITFPQKEISGTLKREFFGQFILKSPYYKKFNTQLVFGYTPLQEKLFLTPVGQTWCI